MSFTVYEINNFLRGRTKLCRDYPNKQWKYKDGLGVRKIKNRNGKTNKN